jgi:putative ATP-binding cassette transporter
MTFLQLVRRGMRGSLPKLLFMSSLGGISSALILAAINAGAQAADGGKPPSLWALVMFLVALFLFTKTQIYVTTIITAEVEAVIHRLRVRLMDQIRHSELLAIEEVGRSRIISAITSDTAILTQASNTLCYSLQAPILIVFVSVYIAYLSVAAFAISAVIVGLAGVIFNFRSRRLAKGRAAAVTQEQRLFDRMTDFLDGFKEVRLHDERSADLFDNAVEISREAAQIKMRTQTETFKMIASSQSYMYLLLAAVVFAAPVFSASLNGAATKTTTALLFVVGAYFGLVQSIPILLNANAAADRLAKLESDLQTTVPTKAQPIAAPKRFDKIEMHSMVFRYTDLYSDTTFQIGPLDFTLQRGELVFITGGNGSGKSTFLRVLAGLYPPNSGELTLDGKPVDDSNRDQYRALMSGIFFDYHLFGRLYGISDPDHAALDRLLQQFGLADKTGLSEDGVFRTIDLSGGQRRRLALIVSLLENRPILLLDEWTAEQDPDFRHKFYEELLPEILQTGATIVAVTHDDRYLDELNLPARRIRMDEGLIVEQRSMRRT